MSDWLGKEEACAMLDLSVSSFDRLRRDDRFPQPSVLGKHLRWKREDIEAFLEKRKRHLEINLGPDGAKFALGIRFAKERT